MKEITFSFGRLNPPTIGHGKLLDALQLHAKEEYRLYLSKTEGNEKNPLPFDSKLMFVKLMFPQHANNVMDDSGINTIFDIMMRLHDEEFEIVNMVVGGDQVESFETLLNRYNNVSARHGLYSFEEINIISAGERDNVSATDARQAAYLGDLDLFKTYLPKEFGLSSELFRAVTRE